MGSRERVVTTIVIWVFSMAAVVGSIPLNSGNVDGGVVAMLVLGALLGTGMVWNWGRLPLVIDGEQAASGKSKRSRGDRVSVLRELLTDDEFDAFKQRLMDEASNSVHYGEDNFAGSDGELPLATLLDDQPRRNRR